MTWWFFVTFSAFTCLSVFPLLPLAHLSLTLPPSSSRSLFALVTCILTCLPMHTSHGFRDEEHSDCAAMVPVWHSHSLCFVTQLKSFLLCIKFAYIKMSVHFFSVGLNETRRRRMDRARVHPSLATDKNQQPNNQQTLLHTYVVHTEQQQQQQQDVVNVVALAIR